MYSEIAANKRKTVLLMLGFVVVIICISYLASTFLGESALQYTILFSLGYLFWSYFASASLALSINGAKQIQKSDDPRLWRIVENLSITTGMPMPKIYIIEDKGLNAFATGRDPKHASVAATTGLLQVLDDNELQGVMAHELGHVQNYDIRVSMIAFALVGVISLLCDMFLRIAFFGGGDDADTDNAYLMLVAVFAMFLAPIVAMFIQLSISRKREYLADATGALTTRYPEGLASALEKIRDNGSTVRRQNSSTAHLYIANPLKGKSISSLLSTHPPIDERIARLRGMGEKL